MSEMIEWRPIPEWEGCYEASNTGLIRSIDRAIRHATGVTHRHKGRVLRPKINNNGYKMVGLYDAPTNRSEFKTVHRLVALTFLPNPNALPEINHIDGNKLNCAFENLEWCTEQHNSRHSTRLRLNPVSKLTDAQVREVLISAANGETARSLARRFGVNVRGIKRIKSGESYRWVNRQSLGFAAAPPAPTEAPSE